MPFFKRTYDQIVYDTLDSLAQNTNITQLSPGGKARFFLETLGKEQADQHETFDKNLLQTFIKYADSRFLDFFGDMFNLPKIESSHASSSEEEENVIFYTTGTFGDLNSGVSFNIPSGTTVRTVAYEDAVYTPGIPRQPVIEYITTQTVTCEASLSFVYVSVRAKTEGASSDVPKNVLNDHTFSSYALANKRLLKCTNRYSISNGTDRESVESYRYRLNNIWKARNLAVLMSIRLAALSVPGVVDTKEVPYEQGPGTFSVYVESTTPTVSPKLLTEVAIAINEVQSFGIRSYVLGPETIGLEFALAVKWDRKASRTEKDRGYVNIRTAIESYINNLGIGEKLEFDSLVSVALRASSLIIGIGDSNINGFEEVYVHRKNPLTFTSTIRSLLIGEEVVPMYNEKIILETSNTYRGIRFLER